MTPAIYFALLQEVVAKSSSDGSFYVIVGLAITNLLSPYLTYRLSRPKNIADTTLTETQAQKVKVDAVAVAIDQMLKVSATLKTANDDIFLLKANLGNTTQILANLRVDVLDVFESIEAVCSLNPAIKIKLAKIKANLAASVTSP